MLWAFRARYRKLSTWTTANYSGEASGQGAAHRLQPELAPWAVTAVAQPIAAVSLCQSWAELEQHQHQV